MATTATAMYDENSPFNVWADKWFFVQSQLEFSMTATRVLSAVRLGIFLITSEIHL